MIDKMYVMLKKLDINTRDIVDIRKDMYNAIISNEESKGKTLSYKEKKEISTDLDIFLRNPRPQLYPLYWGLYKRFAYKVTPPADGTDARNNKIVDMTYEVLTHETNTDKVLNPGGFEDQKTTAYKVAAYKAGKGSWDYLSGETSKALSKLAYTEKNLTFLDTHVDFYNQNNAAGSLIGTFAVHKVAHAVLEGDDIYVPIVTPFKLNGTIFKHSTLLDPREDTKGQLIGKVLGSLVASAADAVKDPILNLMNINGYTSSLLTSLIRIGVDWETAALIMSQNILTDVLNELYTENLTKFATLKDIITKRIKKYEKDNGYDSNNDLIKELEEIGLNTKDLLKGLKDNDEKDSYKVLKLYESLLEMSEAIKAPTYATRFNSISNAVGPLAIDNVIMEHKVNNSSDKVVDRNGTPLVFEQIIEKHPILQSFYGTLYLAKDLLSKVPAGSRAFHNLLFNQCPSSLSNVLLSNRTLLSKFSDFFQSYLMVSGDNPVIDANKLSYYVNEFPSEYLKEGYSRLDQYKNNAIIRSIKPSVNEETGRVSLEIDTTGLEITDKEVLSSAWWDLYNINQSLALKLFEYNFFKGGIGYSPKTFMSLLPLFIKEKINGYNELFENIPDIYHSELVEQFVRNNATDEQLVPTIDKVDNKEASYIVNYNQIAASKIGERNAKNVYSFKVKNGDTYEIFVQVGVNEKSAYFKKVSALGNNGEYLEISTGEIIEALTPTKIKPSKVEDSDVINKENEDNNDIFDEAIRREAEEASRDKEQQIKEHLSNTLKEQGVTIVNNKVEEVIDQENICK